MPFTKMLSTRLTAVVGALVAVALLAGCGGDDKQAQTPDAPATLTVGVIPIIDVAPLYLGMEKGFFEKRKLTIKTQLAAGGAAIVPAVLSESNQIGFSNNVSLLVAQSRKLPLEVVANGAGISPEAKAGGGTDAGYCEVIAGKASGVRDAKALEGKTLAVNTLNNIGDVTIRNALDKAGVDSSKVKFTELPFPDMIGALKSGRIDAAWECEPFVSQLVSEGARPLLNNYASTDPNLAVASYFTSKPFAEKNPTVVRRFGEAMRESLAYASKHPDEARAVVSKYTKIPADATSSVGLPEWSPDINLESVQRLADLAVKYGAAKTKPDVDALFKPQR